jgi:hypothetical protein
MLPYITLIEKVSGARLPTELSHHVYSFLGAGHIVSQIKDNYVRAVERIESDMNGRLGLRAFRRRIYAPAEYKWHWLDYAYYFSVVHSVRDRQFINFIKDSTFWYEYTPELTALFQELQREGIVLSYLIESSWLTCRQRVVLYARVGLSRVEL